MKAFRLLLSAVLILLGAGCTQNNGYIGDLFGSWCLQSIMCGTEPYPSGIRATTYWSFQSDVIRVTAEYEYHYVENYYGTFEQVGDNILRLDFTHSDDDTAAGTGQYQAPTWMGFPASGIINLTIAQSEDDLLVLTYDSPDNGTLVYTFVKVW